MANVNGRSFKLAWEVPGDINRTTATAITASSTNITVTTALSSIDSQAKCIGYYAEQTFQQGLNYCNATFDSYLCWPPTEGGATAYQNCPPARLSDTSQLAFRQCGMDGLWLGRRKNESSSVGWTNYTPCFPAEVRNLFGKVYDDEADPQAMFRIAQITRNMEICGFSGSFVALFASIIVFTRFRALRNSRTKIHRNLFLAMLLQVIVRLVLYFDQAFIRTQSDNDPSTFKGLDSVPYICEACYILLEYGISAMFCWMFIEGLYLYSVVTTNALREQISYLQYCILGWGFPVATTSIWATITAVHYRNTNVQQCWYGYNFLVQYWASQAPRICEVTINMFFLINIMRVLIVKLNQTQDSELEKLRKAVRAALVLLPLLGITNILSMIEAPLDGSIWKFALWSYVTHFLRSFQGIFIALIYCFLNGEVRQVLMKHYMDWATIRSDQKRRRREALERRRRRQSPTQGFTWTQEIQDDNEDGLMEMDIELNEYEKCSLYRNPDVLNRLPTIRFDEDTNVTDSF